MKIGDKITLGLAMSLGGGLVVVGLVGCLPHGNQTIYKDSDVKVIYCRPVTFRLDALPPGYAEIKVAGHSYLLDSFPDSEGKGFLKTPDGSSIVFIEGGSGHMMDGTLHVVSLKTKLDVAVPLNIEWNSHAPNLTVSSYDGHRLMLLVNPNGGSEVGGNLEIDLDAKRVVRFERTTSSVPAK